MKKTLLTAAVTGAGFFSQIYANQADSTAVFRISDLQEVVVSVNRDRIHKINSPQHIVSIPKSLIDYTNQQNTADLLMSTGQVSIQKSQQGGGSPILRGFEASRILLVIDGIRMNNLIYRNGHLQNSITTDQFTLENVEIINGPSSLNYGSDALGGTILFNTLAPRLSENPSKQLFDGNAAIRYGSANQEGTVHLDLNYGTSKFASLTSFTFSHFGDLRAGTNRNPFLPENDSYQQSLIYTQLHTGADDEAIVNSKPELQKRSGYIQYDILQKFLFQPSPNNKHTINFQLSNANGINRYDRLNVTETIGDKLQPKYAEWYYGPQFRLMTAYHYDGKNQFGADKTHVGLAYQKVKESRHDRKFRKEELYHTWEDVDIISLNSDWIKYIGTHKIHSGIDGTLSLLHSTASAENVVTGEKTPYTTRYPDGQNSMHTLEAFITHIWHINESWSMHDGLRAGYATTYSTVKDTELFPFYGSKSQRKNNPTYSMAWGLNYLPARTWKLALNAATAYRVPNIDNASKVFESKLNTVTIPNKNLKPEKTVSVDLNITKHAGEKLIWENVIYGTYFFDAITTSRGSFMGSSQMEYKGTLCDVYTQTNAKAAVLWGVSSNLTAKPSKQTELNASFNYTYGKIVKGEVKQPLDHIPPIYGKVGIAYLPRNGKGRIDFYALYNGKKDISGYNADGEDNIDYATTLGAKGQGMPAWFTLNIKGSYNLSSSFTLQAGIENLLDTEYRMFASGINAPGRNIYGTVRISF